MTLLFLLAAGLLILSAVFFFGPQLIAYGNHGARDLVRRPEAHFIAMTLITALIVILFVDPDGSSLISDPETVQVVLRT